MTPYEKAFSTNVLKYRKQFSFTQKMLAEVTGHSEKTVSKEMCNEQQRHYKIFLRSGCLRKPA